MREHWEEDPGERGLPLPRRQQRLQVVEEQRPLERRQRRRSDVTSFVAAQTSGSLKQRTPGHGPKVPVNKKQFEKYNFEISFERDK